MAQAIRAILLARATAATFCVSALHRLARAMPGEDTFVIDLISALSTQAAGATRLSVTSVIELARATRVAREISFSRDENPKKRQWYLAVDI